MTSRDLAIQLFVLVSIGAAAAAAPPASSEQWINKVDGQYVGELMTGGNATQVTTTFKYISEGAVDGQYVFLEPGNHKVSGELTPCEVKGPHELVCHWHDPYGTGLLVVHFDKSLRSFRGQWSDQQGIRWLPWSGTLRQRDSSSDINPTSGENSDHIIKVRNFDSMCCFPGEPNRLGANEQRRDVSFADLREQGEG